jgi:hypothetical protein
VIRFLFGWAVVPGAPWWAYLIVAVFYVFVVWFVIGVIKYWKLWRKP